MESLEASCEELIILWRGKLSQLCKNTQYCTKHLAFHLVFGRRIKSWAALGMFESWKSKQLVKLLLSHWYWASHVPAGVIWSHCAVEQKNLTLTRTLSLSWENAPCINLFHCFPALDSDKNPTLHGLIFSSLCYGLPNSEYRWRGSGPRTAPFSTSLHSPWRILFYIKSWLPIPEISLLPNSSKTLWGLSVLASFLLWIAFSN